MRPTLRAAALAAVAALALVGCSGADGAEPDPTSPEPSGESTGEWPRTAEHAAGETEIAARPVRIVSTSPSITGSLLAIDAPLVGTAAATVSGLTDDKGLFAQWADVADERGVEIAYADLELDLEGIEILEPDLIIGSANGGDSTLDAYDQLSEIAPTVLLDYGTPTWQELTERLGEITGLETNAEAVIAEYDAFVAEQSGGIALPAQPVMALVYLGPDGAWAFADETPQSKLLESLGFEYAAIPDEAQVETAGATGVAVVSAENMPSAFGSAETIFVVPIRGPEEVDAFIGDPLLANLPAVSGDRVHTLGPASFRLDYYSAVDTVELLVAEFGS